MNGEVQLPDVDRIPSLANPMRAPQLGECANHDSRAGSYLHKCNKDRKRTAPFAEALQWHTPKKRRTWSNLSTPR